MRILILIDIHVIIIGLYCGLCSIAIQRNVQAKNNCAHILDINGI